jgi:hypothetical protein
MGVLVHFQLPPPGVQCSEVDTLRAYTSAWWREWPIEQHCTILCFHHCVWYRDYCPPQLAVSSIGGGSEDDWGCNLHSHYNHRSATWRKNWQQHNYIYKFDFCPCPMKALVWCVKAQILCFWGVHRFKQFQLSLELFLGSIVMFIIIDCTKMWKTFISWRIYCLNNIPTHCMEVYTSIDDVWVHIWVFLLVWVCRPCWLCKATKLKQHKQLQ